ncbi:EthD family reductase [Nocardia sp. NPDC004278]
MVRYLVLYATPKDPAAFERHYCESHIPLIKVLPGLRRFDFGHSPTPGRGEPYFWVSSLEWDDMAALKAAFTSPEGEAAARDVENLTKPDMLRSMIFEFEEVIH